MSTKTKERIILIGFCLAMVLLLSVYIFHIINTFKPYYQADLNGAFLGYYLSENEYYKLYEEACVNTNDEYDINYFMRGDPQFNLIYIKKKAVKMIDNKQLITNNLEHTYNIYKLLVDNKTELYVPTKQQALLIQQDIQKAAKKTQVEISKMTVNDLSLLSTSEQITELKSKYIRVSKVTSRSGSRITHRTALKIVETNYAWPLTTTTISSYYGARTMRGVTKLHTGIDIPCPLESNVKAVDDGQVIFAEWSGGYGYYIQIDHGEGIVSAYAHLNSLGVEVGDTVTKGQIIGKSGSTGNSTGPHLHLEYIINGQFCNPLTFYQDS